MRLPWFICRQHHVGISISHSIEYLELQKQGYRDYPDRSHLSALQVQRIMFKKILLSLLLLFALLVGFLAIGVYLHETLEQQATAFCDAIPLATPIDVAHFKQTVLRTQPTKIGGAGLMDYGFHINARHDAITEQTIAASGMDEFFNKAGVKSAAEDQQPYITAWFSSFMPFTGYACEIRLEQQRVSSKHLIVAD